MTGFTYVTTCKGRLHHLVQSLPAALRAGPADLVVVDYGCPDGAGAWVREHHPSVKVVTVADDPGFNVARARNAGAAVAGTEWLGFFDVDVVLAPGFFPSIERGIRGGHYFVPDSGDANTWGSCLVERAAFVAAGGYDEAIDTWGGEDNDFYAVLAFHGIRRGHYPGRLLTPIRHADAERTRFHPLKNLDRAVRLGSAYRSIKLDVMRHLARTLSLEERRHLRALAAQLVERAAAGDPQPVHVVLPQRPLKTRPAPAEGDGPVLRSVLLFAIDRYGREHDGPGDDATDGGAAPPQR